MKVKGFSAAAVEAGIRYQDRLDLGIIFSEVPAAAAGVFTQSLVKAAPVLLDMERLKGGRAQAILVNSGIANACTGEAGMKLAGSTAALLAGALTIPEELVQIASTGVIGEQLELSRFGDVMEKLVAGLSLDGIPDVARAIMTTDTVPKTATRKIVIGGHEVTLAGIAKGAGMIMPDMATMLSFIMTDCAIRSDLLQSLLRQSVETSFNAITVDGDTSTNDTVLILANGMAKNPLIEKIDQQEAAVFGEALDDLTKDLALQIVADGEGATKLVTIRVAGARDSREAQAAAKTVANSNLVKTAFFGEDANWGRILAALGRSGAAFDPDRVEIAFDNVVMIKNGLGLGAEEESRATEVLKRDRFTVNIDLHAGDAVFEAYTCDFSLDYVRINADYRS
ncbi:MAG: bifunctional glutamate N-acetyltransferase/amino-acid acetyltransferase ArgJ [Desulfobulbaceae bacterium]|nr:bifunctional glutamate N-acetyltransferase/amino-acid acetyltransferase ArgJ [Desulfobulbaceae bacterium]